MMERTWAWRAGLAARTIRALLRASAITETPAPLVGMPGVALALLSAKRCTSGAMSVAKPCLRVTTSISEAAGWSSAAMILPIRARLSA